MSKCVGCRNFKICGKPEVKKCPGYKKAKKFRK